MMKKLLFIAFLFIYAFAYAGDGDVNVISKIAPKNGAFTGVVDASEALADTTNFDNNLSSVDNTVQKALDTLDDLILSATEEDPLSLHLSTPDQTVNQTPTFSKGLNSSDNINLSSNKKIYTNDDKTSYHYTDASTGWTRFYYSNVEIMRFEH